MKNHKQFCIIFLLLLSVALLTGCNTALPINQPVVEEPAAQEAAGERVEIVAWTFTYQPFVDGLQALADGFNESQSDYQVNVEVFDWDNYWDKIAAAVATGTGPDVFHSYTDINGKYIAQNVLQSLPEELFPYDKMAPMVLQSKLFGKMWSVPMGVRTFAYVYNPEYFEEASLEPPTTWEEEVAVQEALTIRDDNGEITRAGELVAPHWEGYTIWRLRCHQAGGSYISEDLRTFTWDDPACIEAFKFMLSKAREEVWVEGFYENSFATAYAEGAVGGFFGPSGVIGALQDLETPWTVAPMTKGPANDATLGNFWPLVMTQQAQGEKRDAAIAFLQYAATPEANRTWAQITGDIPALLDVAAEDEFVNAQYGEFVKAGPKAVFIFDPDTFNTRIGWDLAWDKVVLEGADPEQALIEGMGMAQEVLDNWWTEAEANVANQ